MKILLPVLRTAADLLPVVDLQEIAVLVTLAVQMVIAVLTQHNVVLELQKQTVARRLIFVVMENVAILILVNSVLTEYANPKIWQPAQILLHCVMEHALQEKLVYKILKAVITLPAFVYLPAAVLPEDLLACVMLILTVT